jgi:hypothetical protein
VGTPDSTPKDWIPHQVRDDRVAGREDKVEMRDDRKKTRR